MWRPIVLALVALSLSLAPAALSRTEPLLVSAAVSLSEALAECGTVFAAEVGRRVAFNFAASNTLARQVVQGAAADVFVSADEAQMDVVERAGLLVPGTRRIVAANRLAVIVPGRGVAAWNDPSWLASAAVRRLAVGEPTSVPVGVYAKTWLDRIGMWSRVQARLVPTASARATVAAVRSGGADAGIVYRTDVSGSGGVSLVYEVSGPEAPSIEYPAAVLRQTRNRDLAKRFLDFLRTHAGRRILRSHGFLEPNPS